MATVNGGKGSDAVEGSDLADELFGGKGNDSIFGGNGGDTIKGGKGNDVVFGGEGNDWLEGGNGRDQLFGGNGDDALIGGKGKDVLTGGEGSDTFIFRGNSSKDKIMDFDVENDVLQIAKSKKFDSAQDVADSADVNKHGDVVINLGGGDKIVLKGVSLEDFQTNPEDHIDVV